MTTDPFAVVVDPNLVHFGPFDGLEADDATGLVADALRDRRPGLASTITTFWLGGRRKAEVEWVPQDHRSGYGYLHAVCTGGAAAFEVMESFRRQDEDEDAAVERIGVVVADWLLGEP